MSSNPGLVKLAVHSTSVCKLHFDPNIFIMPTFGGINHTVYSIMIKLTIIEIQLSIGVKNVQDEYNLLSVWVAGSNDLQSILYIQRTSIDCSITHNLLHKTDGFCCVGFIKKQHSVNMWICQTIFPGKLVCFFHLLFNFLFSCSTMNLQKSTNMLNSLAIFGQTIAIMGQLNPILVECQWSDGG